MNFKMRMRKLDIRSIRAPSAVRLKLIELNGLPPHSPVCGLIKISEMERLAKSYGVFPPNVIYDVFLTKELLQYEEHKRKHPEPLPTIKQPGKHGRPQKKALPFPPLRPSFQPQHQYPQAIIPSSMFPLHLSHHYQVPYLGPRPRQGAPATSLVMMSSSTSGATVDGDSLIVSIPRQLTYLKISPEQQVAMVTQATPTLPATIPPPFGGSLLQNLAKKISQKNKKLGIQTSARHCPSCQKINPAVKKRCEFCGEFLIGRPCPRCGTLNHNRTKDCFKCNSPIPFSWEKYETCT